MSKRSCRDCENGTIAAESPQVLISCKYTMAATNIAFSHDADICKYYSERVDECGDIMTLDSGQKIRCGKDAGHLGTHSRTGVTSGTLYVWTSPTPELCGAIMRQGNKVYSDTLCTHHKGHNGSHGKTKKCADGGTSTICWSDPTPTAFDKAWEEWDFSPGTPGMEIEDMKTMFASGWQARGKALHEMVHERDRQGLRCNANGLLDLLAITAEE